MNETLVEELRHRNAELQSAYAEIDRAIDISRRVWRLLLPRQLPMLEGLRVSVYHRPRPRAGCVLYDATIFGEGKIVVWLAEVGGAATLAGWCGVAVKAALSSFRTPSEALIRANRALIDLQLDPPPLAGMVCISIDIAAGCVQVSRGGLPPPIRVPVEGPAEVWVGSCPFLGLFEADFPAECRHLRPGEKLLLRTGTPPADADPVPPAAIRHRPLGGDDYVHAVARDVGRLDEDGEFSALVLEYGTA